MHSEAVCDNISVEGVVVNLLTGFLYPLLTLSIYRRFHIRGAKHVIFYSLPEYANFYSEYVNMLSAHTDIKQSGKSGSATEEDNKISCLVLYTAYERMALERIVGAKRCAHMLAASKSTFVYC